MNVFAPEEAILSIREDKARKNIEESLKYFRLDWNNISSIIAKYYPLEILKMAVWESRRIEQSNKNDEVSKAAMRFFPYLLQNIVQSKDFAPDRGFAANRDIKQKDWNRLKELGYDAARRILWYIQNYAVLMVKEGRIRESFYAEYRDKLYRQFFFEEMTDDKERHCSLLLDALFFEEDEAAQELFHTSGESLIKAIKSLSDLGCHGIDELSAESLAIQAMIRGRAEKAKAEGSTLSDEALVDKISKEKDIKPIIDRFCRKRDDFDLFSVEANTLLSTETCKVLSQSVSSYDGPDFTVDGFMEPAYYPFLRFGDRFYTFTAKTLCFTFPIAIRRVFHSNDRRFLTSEKMQNITSYYLSQIMNETDIPDVYSWYGYKLDVVTLSSIRWLNAFRHPEFYQERFDRREEEKRGKARLGHTLLIIDTDGIDPLKKVNDNTFTISLSALSMLKGDTEGIRKLYFGIFGAPPAIEPPQAPELEEIYGADDIYSDEEDSSIVFDDEVSELFPGEDSEFDDSDDDAKAEAINQKYDHIEDMVTTLPEVQQKSSEEIARMYSEYELPEEYLQDDDTTSDFSALESDDYITPEEEEKAEQECLEEDELDYSLLDEEDSADEEEEYDSFDNNDEDDLFDAAIDEEDFDEGMHPDEPLFSYHAPDDSGQLSLFSDDYSSNVVEASEDEEADEVENSVIADSNEEELFSFKEADEEEASLYSEESEETQEAEEETELYADELINEETSVEETPVEDTPVEDTPVEDTPVEDTPVEDTPVEDTPVEDTPVEDVPVEDVPAFELKDDIHVRYPLLIERILEVGGSSLPKAFNSFVTSSEHSTLEDFSEAIKNCASKAKSDGKDKLLSIWDNNLSIVITGDSRREDDLKRQEIRNNVGAVMFSREATDWSYLVLSNVDDLSNMNVRSEVLTESSFSASDWKIVRVVGQNMINKRQGL